jgi:hypothetical protein
MTTTTPPSKSFWLVCFITAALQSHAFLVPTAISRHKPLTVRYLNNFFNFNKPEPKTAEAEKEEDTFEDGAYDEDDPVEKIFGFFFGKREAKPMGMCKFFHVEKVGITGGMESFSHNIIFSMSSQLALDQIDFPNNILLLWINGPNLYLLMTRKWL